MFRPRKIILLAALGVLAIAIGLFAARGAIAGWIVGRVIQEAQDRGAARGVRLMEVEPGRATLTGLFSMEVEGLRGRLVLPRGVVSSEAESFSVVARRLRVRLDSVFPGRVVISLGEGSIYKLAADGNPSGEWLSDLVGEGVVTVSWRNPSETVAFLEDQARLLLEKGTMDIAARLRGRARFKIRRTWCEAMLFSETDGRTTRVVLEREDVKRASAAYAQPLTDSEIDLVSGYPTLAPALLQIADQAKRVAAERRRADRAFPEDAFRHVYWSFLLTREFGPEFARVVTDAHEIEATYEKGEADRVMDLQNNAVGRDYALAGVGEAELERRVRSDVRVMKKPR